MPVQIINYSSFEALHCKFISFYIIILRISLNYDRELRLSFFFCFCFNEHADKSLSEGKYIYGMYVKLTQTVYSFLRLPFIKKCLPN